MPIFQSSRKVQVMGTSHAITLPAFFCKACEIEKGVKVNVFFNLHGTLIVTLCNNPNDFKKNLSQMMEDIEDIINSHILKESSG